MSSLDEFRAVDRSLDSFKALRDGLGYLRSISVCFELDEASKSRLFSLMAAHAMAADGTVYTDEADELSRNYFQMTVALLYSLLYAALDHYLDLIKSNDQLKHEELEATLHEMRACGLFDTLRRLRNAVFHVDPNESVGALMEEVRRLATEHQIVIRKVEDLLYEGTEQVFRGTEIYRQSRETLDQAYQEALAYYREHLADKEGPDEPGDQFFAALERF